MIVKPMSVEVALNAATDVDGATVVRLVNTGNSTSQVSVKDGNVIVASVTLAAGESLNVEKKSTQKLLATASVLAAKIAYSN